ncbi:MAG: hypothetical protein MUF86_14330, partial [Akkermansiaceae bacterium]|nr:hypothetical protein [Akkermansiaceae bacterium]
MKPYRLHACAAFALFLAAGCDKPAQDAGRIRELETRAAEAVARQQELERELENQRLAAERDAIERERMLIEQARAELEQRQSENAAAETEALRQREEELARREDRAGQIETELDQKRDELAQRGIELNDRDRELAGREAIDFGNGDGFTQEPVADYGMFYDSLSAYGSWFETPDYGYVWQPVIVRDVSWRPYTRGRWVCTDYGWTWISDEPFGWATYHYGRWALLRGVGWVWVPGSQWAPSWVSWRSSGSHIGWAPLPPETLVWSGGSWGSNIDVTFGIGSLWFNFVEIRHFGGPIHRHCLPYQRNPDFYRETTNITHIHLHNRRVICGGPKYADLSRRLGKPLPFYRLDTDHRGRPGRDASAMRPRFEGDRLRVAAPQVDAQWNAALKPGRVRDRLQSITVEREQPLQPEVANRFRESRRENRVRAEKSITDLGGRESFQQRRLERLEANRRQAGTRERDTSQAVTPRVEETAPKETMRLPQPESAPRDARADAGRGQSARPREMEQPQTRPQATETTSNTQTAPQAQGSVAEVDETAREPMEIRRRQEQQAEQLRRQQQVGEARRQQQEQAREQLRKQQEEVQNQQQAELARRQQQEQAREQLRKQQEEAQSQQ